MRKRIYICINLSPLLNTSFKLSELVKSECKITPISSVSIWDQDFNPSLEGAHKLLLENT